MTSIPERAKSIKLRFMKMYRKANAGHVGSSLSCADLVTVIKFDWMKDNDRFILSKGHAAAALYSVLAEAGEISEEEIATFYQNGTRLPAHPPVNQFPSIPFATGSLGHGLSLAAGFGLSQKLSGRNGKIFCVTSDGELNEGSTWEAALFIAHQQLQQVIWIIDRNRLQGFGNTEEVIKMEPLSDKLASFGFEVMVVNGHDHKALMELKQSLSNRQKPLAIIANTIKGNGWERMQDQLGCHYLPIGEEDYNALITQLEGGSNS